MRSGLWPGEAALNDALLHAVERYQGAQAAGDAEWALTHARQAHDLAATLAAARDFWFQAYSSGFTAEERRALRNQGLSIP